MGFVRLYGRVMGELAPEKWLAAALVLANVALAVSQFAEPLIFGKVIDQLSQAQSGGGALTWAGIGPGSPPGRRSASSPSSPASPSRCRPTGWRIGGASRRWRLLRPCRAPADELSRVRPFRAAAQGDDRGRLTGMFGVWLSFFREHCAALRRACRPAADDAHRQLAARGDPPRPGRRPRRSSMNFVICTARRRCRAPPTSTATIWPSASRTCSATCRSSRVLPAPTTRQGRCGALIDRMLNAQLPVLTWWALATVATRASSTLTLLAILVIGVCARHERADDGRPDRRLHEPRDDADRAARADRSASSTSC